MKHRNIEIQLTNDGKFSAIFGGRTHTLNTLAAIKKKIDGGVNFTPFTALLDDGTKVSIVALEHNARIKYGSRYRPKHYFSTEGGAYARKYTDVITDTSANVALLAQIKKLDEEFDAYKRKIEDKIDALRDKLTKRHASEEYLASQEKQNA